MIDSLYHRRAGTRGMPTSSAAPLLAFAPADRSWAGCCDLRCDIDTETRRRPMSETVLPHLFIDHATAQLPSDPNDLLSPAEHEALADDLAKLARLRRDAETASASLRLA